MKCGEIYGVELKTREEVVPYAKKMQQKGARNVLVSMAGEGAVLVSEDGQVYMSPSPDGQVKNSVGAGDSMEISHCIFGHGTYIFRRSRKVDLFLL